MLPALLVVVGAVIGFVGSRRLRRPEQRARAASVARTVGGTVGRRRTLTAPELQRACFSEMVRHVRVTRDGHSHAPGRYVLCLHPDDLAVVDDTRHWFTGGLTDALREAAQTNGWALDDAIDITYEADPSRRPGVPNALAVSPGAGRGSAPSGPPPVAGGATSRTSPARPGALVRADNRKTVSLGDQAITIGRSRDRTIVVDDDRVSRAHAHLECSGQTWSVMDDGSSNGTRVNGDDIGHEPRRLRVGDVIGVGPLDLQVQGRPADGPEPGTRALDDSDRTRIASTVLPPREDRR